MHLFLMLLGVFLATFFESALLANIVWMCCPKDNNPLWWHIAINLTFEGICAVVVFYSITQLIM